MRYKIIFNPNADRGGSLRYLPLIEKSFRQYGLNYAIVQTERPWHAAELAGQAAAAGYDVVVAAGGDGTVNEVFSGLLRTAGTGHKRPALGVLPIGRGNDFAFGMGIPLDFAQSCAALAAGRRKWVDIGLLSGGDYPQGRYFGNGVGIGFDAVVNLLASRNRHIKGILSYLVAVLQTILIYFHSPRVRLEYDGQCLEQKCLMISIMNGRRMAGAFMMAPDGQVDDGLLNLTIALEVSRLTILALIPRFIQGSQYTHPRIRTLKARRLTVTALDQPLPVHADGEMISTGADHLTIELLPERMEIVW